MRPYLQRHHSLKWPSVIAVTVGCLFAFVFLVPAEWINLFFSPLDTSLDIHQSPQGNWLVILPPPVLESVSQAKTPPVKPERPEQKAPLVNDPGWWTAAWEVKSQTNTRSLLVPASRDSVALLLKTLGVGLDFTRKALPDSILDHRLMLLRIEDSFAFEELKPYLSALGKARALADKQSREAAMYDEHLGSTIMVPD